MTESINFLRDKFDKIKKEKKRDLIINSISFSILAVYAIVLVAIFIYLSIVRNEAKVLDAKTNNLKNEILGFQTAETKQIYLKNKVKALKTIIIQQKENQKITEAIFELIPEGVSINSFSIAETGKVSFSVDSPTASSLKELINSLKLNTDFGDLKLDRVDIGSINFNSNNGYILNLVLYFKFQA